MAHSTQVLSTVVRITGYGTRHLEDAPVGTKRKQPAAPLPQAGQPGRVKRRRTATPPDLRVPRPSLDARDEAKRAAPSTSCAAVPTPSSNEPQVIQTLSVARNLSIPSKEVGQHASSCGMAYRFTTGGLVQLIDLLKQLDERARRRNPRRRPLRQAPTSTRISPPTEQEVQRILAHWALRAVIARRHRTGTKRP